MAVKELHDALDLLRKPGTTMDELRSSVRLMRRPKGKRR
jgi:hypothetical protein